MLYDVRDHDLLSDDAAALDRELLDVYALMAEKLLGLEPPAFTDATDIAVAKVAVVRQVNRLLRFTPDAAVLASWTNGTRTEVYRDNPDLFDPIAVGLIDALVVVQTNKEKYSDWMTVRSVRNIATTQPGLVGTGRDIIPVAPLFPFGLP